MFKEKQDDVEEMPSIYGSRRPSTIGQTNAKPKGGAKTVRWVGKNKLLLARPPRHDSIDSLLYGEYLTLPNRKSMANAFVKYVDSFARANDKRYLPNENVRRNVVSLRCITGACSINKEEFARKGVQTNKPLGMGFFFSESKFSDDPLIQALAEREKPNIMKSLSTIIFICTRNSKGLNISGYIDYEHSLRRFKSGNTSEDRNWSQIFSGRQRLKPCKKDLSYMNWKSGAITYNDSDNYKILPLSIVGLCFEHKGDNCIIDIEKRVINSYHMCFEIESPKHGSIILCDHRVRRQN